MHPASIAFSFLTAITLLPLSALASEPTIHAEASLDLVLYDDDADGEASHLLQDTLGIYNVHDTGHAMDHGFNVQRAGPGRHQWRWQGRPGTPGIQPGLPAIPTGAQLTVTCSRAKENGIHRRCAPSGKPA